MPDAAQVSVLPSMTVTDPPGQYVALFAAIKQTAELAGLHCNNSKVFFTFQKF